MSAVLHDDDVDVAQKKLYYKRRENGRFALRNLCAFVVKKDAPRRREEPNDFTRRNRPFVSVSSICTKSNVIGVDVAQRFTGSHRFRRE